MRVVCHLRRLRGDRTLAEIAQITGVSVPHLSQIERGIMLPFDSEVDGLARAFGSPVNWYSPLALLAIQEDDR